MLCFRLSVLMPMLSIWPTYNLSNWSETNKEHVVMFCLTCVNTAKTLLNVKKKGK